MATQRIGGTFAPPLDAAKLTEYEKLAKSAPPQVKEAMTVLVKMVREFRKTPKSKVKGTQHPSKMKGAVITPLEDKEKERMFEFIPWKEELDMYEKVFDALPTGTKEGPLEAKTDSAGMEYRKPKLVVEDKDAKALRDACFHLLWYGRELDLDREPITSDQLEG